jgi:hypothetical protein
MNIYFIFQELCHVEVNNVLFAFHNLLVYKCSMEEKKWIQLNDRIRIIDLKEEVETNKKDRHQWHLSNHEKTNDFFFAILYIK